MTPTSKPVIPYKGFSINLSSRQDKYYIMYGRKYLTNYGHIITYPEHHPFYDDELGVEDIFLYDDVPACQKWINWIIENKTEILV